MSCLKKILLKHFSSYYSNSFLICKNVHLWFDTKFGLVISSYWNVKNDSDLGLYEISQYVSFSQDWNLHQLEHWKRWFWLGPKRNNFSICVYSHIHICICVYIKIHRLLLTLYSVRDLIIIEDFIFLKGSETNSEGKLQLECTVWEKNLFS